VTITASLPQAPFRLRQSDRSGSANCGVNPRPDPGNSVRFPAKCELELEAYPG
jgi:hypothetical protein